jgi:hypothetical protein
MNRSIIFNLIFPEHMSSPPVFEWASCSSIFSFLYCVLEIAVWPFVLFPLSIVLYVLQFTSPGTIHYREITL